MEKVCSQLLISTPTDGKVETADLPNVPASFNTSYIEEGLGITL